MYKRKFPINAHLSSEHYKVHVDEKNPHDKGYTEMQRQTDRQTDTTIVSWPQRFGSYHFPPREANIAAQSTHARDAAASPPQSTVRTTEAEAGGKLHVWPRPSWPP